MKIKLTKLKESENPLFSNNIEVGDEVVGDFVKEPTIGEGFIVIRSIGKIRLTSAVQEIIDENTFRTFYKWEKI